VKNPNWATREKDICRGDRGHSWGDEKACRRRRGHKREEKSGEWNPKPYSLAKGDDPGRIVRVKGEVCTIELITHVKSTAVSSPVAADRQHGGGIWTCPVTLLQPQFLAFHHFPKLCNHPNL